MSTAHPRLLLPFVEPEIFTALTLELGFVPGGPVRPLSAEPAAPRGAVVPAVPAAPPAPVVRLVPDPPAEALPAVRVQGEPTAAAWAADEGETTDETVSSWRAAVVPAEPAGPAGPAGPVEPVEPVEDAAPAEPLVPAAPLAVVPTPAPAPVIAPSGRRLPSMPPIARSDG